MKSYKSFLNEGKAEDKAIKKIKKFFGIETIIKKAVDINPKLSIWIINKFLEKTIPNMSKEFKEKVKNDKLNEDEMQTIIGDWMAYSPKFQYIIDWVNSFDITPEEKSNFTKLSFDEAYEKSDNWHNSLVAGGVIEDEHGEVIMTFPDGFYWIDLQTTYDRDEADAMGHCGTTNKGNTLYSLRDRNKSPHVTAAVDDNEGIIYQMKGRNNQKPIKKYHLYIVGLLTNDDLNYPLKGFGAEYDKSNDFEPDDLETDLLKELKEKRPNIDDPVHTEEDLKNMFDNMLDSYYMQEYQYMFTLVSWCYDVCGIESVISAMRLGGNDLFRIMTLEYPEKIKNDVNDYNVMLNIASSYINANDVADKYNIELTNPKDSASNKWDEIYKYIGDEGLENEVKSDQNVWDKYENEINSNYDDEFANNFKTSYGYDRKKRFDPELIIEYFIGDDEKKIMSELERLFDGSEEWKTDKDGKSYSEIKDNYYQYMNDVFDLWDLAHDISYKLTIEQIEEELSNNFWYEYIGY